MKRQNWGQYFAAGITAFTVIAAAILLFFLLDHFSFVRSLAGTVFYILRPIFYGMVLAFLLLPVHRFLFQLLWEMCQGLPFSDGAKKSILNAVSIFLSLMFLFLLLYILLAMVLPQLYWSVVGLFNALPGYF